MNARFSLVADAHVQVANAGRHIPEIARHLEEHGARVWSQGEATILDFDFSRGVMEQSADALLLRAEAGDPSLLQEIKMELVEHVAEFTGIKPSSIEWRGAQSDSDTPPNFRLMRVVSSERVTPHMQRLRLAGSNLMRFSGSSNLHCKLLIPQAGIEPEWPYLDEGGSFRWANGTGKPAVRKYTIRSIDVEAGTLDIDMVIHADGGPGSAWAVTAKAGDEIGMVGPGGRGVRAADWYLLAGDETALPAIARTIESLPAGTRGIALIEVADRLEEQPIRILDGFRIEWLHRNGAEPGTTSLLPDAVRAVQLPDADESVFVWCGCEFSTFKTIRAYVRKELRLAPESHLVTSYWRKGMSDDGARRMNTISSLIEHASRIVDR